MELLKDRKVVKVWRDGPHLVKTAFDEVNKKWLLQHWKALQALKHTPYVPKPISFDGETLVTEFIEGNTVTDTFWLRYHLIHMLYRFQEAGLVHGDSTGVNMRIRHNIPIVFDWDQSTFVYQTPRPQSKPRPDIHFALPVVAKWGGDPSRILRRWHHSRLAIEYYRGWGTFLDLGTHKGEFPALATIDGMKAHGIDGEYIRPCINEARDLYGLLGCTYEKEDIFLMDNYEADVVMLFSTWAYIVGQHSQQVGDYVLRQCIAESNILLFETQLYRDGPGLEIHRTDEDVVDHLYKLGATHVEPVVTLEKVTDGKLRTVWKVT